MLKSALAAGALLTCGSAFAQNPDVCTPCGSDLRDAGVLNLATGRFSQALGGATEDVPGVIYNNTCPTPSFSSLLSGSTVIDDGRIPTTSSPSPNHGNRQSYRVTSFQFAYCTRELDPGLSGPGATVRVRFFADNDDCQDLASLGAPLADFTLTGLPASTAVGTLSCYILTVDLTGGFEFCLTGDSDGFYGGSTSTDGFGYAFGMPNQTGTTTATSGGFVIAGDVTPPGDCVRGDGTFYKNVGSATGTGLDNDDLFRREGSGTQSTGCLFFGGNPLAGFYLKLTADLVDCSCDPNDTDGDGTVDCQDGCPLDPNKVAPGQCGCGNPDTDTDGDGTADCVDSCPNDPTKTLPGTCGCGVADVDTDGDGVLDCQDGCPNDPNKLTRGQCGCGQPETDTDGDGTADCLDACPNDPAKTLPGFCGCGTADTDTDGDATPDCADDCPNDPAKIDPGQCGCGNSDIDTDGDGTADCNDLCPNDPDKTDPGQCDCGTPDTDTDGDGTADCNDLCPNDPVKIAPGVCGCGTADTDTDGDGTADCNDGCPTDPDKIAPGICGCNVADLDTDGDGTFDCFDGCPTDPLKVDPGQCGCGNPDDDSDLDGIADCNDNCDLIPNPGQEDCNDNGIGDVCDISDGLVLDVNANDVPDECEPGSGTPFCFGDGSGNNCPCGNDGTSGHGCLNSSGNGGLMYNFGGNSVGAGDTAIYISYLPSNKFGIVYMGTGQPGGGLGLPFGDGLRCVGGFTKRYLLQNSGLSGHFQQLNPGASAPALILPGTTWFFQAWFRDEPGTSPCGTNINLSNGLQIDFVN